MWRIQISFWLLYLFLGSLLLATLQSQFILCAFSPLPGNSAWLARWTHYSTQNQDSLPNQVKCFLRNPTRWTSLHYDCFPVYKKALKRRDLIQFILLPALPSLVIIKNMTWKCESELGDVPKKWMTPKIKFKGKMISTHERDRAHFQHLAKGRVQVPWSLLDGIIRSPPFSYNHQNVDKLDQISGTQLPLPKLAPFTFTGS